MPTKKNFPAAYSGKLELSISNGEGREPFILTEDKKLLSQLPVRDKMILTAKLCPAGSAAASSPDSSSDSSTSCPQHAYDTPGAAEEVEASLPGVVCFRPLNYRLAFPGGPKEQMCVPQIRKRVGCLRSK